MIRWLRRIVPRWVSPETEVRDEITAHLEMRAEELIQRGQPASLARAQAEREFGNVPEAIAELSRIDRPVHQSLRLGAIGDDLRTDLRLGLRMLLRAPGFTLSALATLGLAIGGNTAAFSLFNEVLLRRLPYPEADRLVIAWEEITSRGRISEASWPDFLDWRAQSHSFSALEAFNPTNATVSLGTGARMVQGAWVTGGFFSALGQGPAIGRGFRPEDEVSGGPQVAIVSHQFWQDQLGGSPGVLDSVLTVNGQPVQVVGVLPASFRFTAVGAPVLWLPFNPSDPSRHQRINHQVRVLGRLRPGTTLAEGTRGLAAVMGRLASDYPETNQGRSARLVPLADEVTGPARPVVLALLFAMVLVLAVAVANIAALLSARAVARSEEMQVRAALGATRARLVRQLLVESLVLSALGGMLGLAIAAVLLRLLATGLPEAVRTQFAAPEIAGLTGAGLWYSLLLTLVTGVGFGLSPVLHVLRPAGKLTGAGRRVIGGGAHWTLRNGLIVGEVALTMALLTGAALVGRSLGSLLGKDPGFQPEGVATARIALAGPRYAQSNQAQQQFFERLLSEIRGLPGVQSVGAVDRLPLEGGGMVTFRVEGQAEVPPSQREPLVSRTVAGDYFQSMRIPLVAGRHFTAEDDSAHAPVVLLDQATATRLLGGANPVGARLRFYALPGSAWEVIGVVGTVQTGDLDGPERPTVYFTHLQAAANRLSVVARTAGDPAVLIRAIRAAAARLDRDAAVYAERTLEAQVGESAPVLFRRLSLLLLALCAGLALVLSVVGVYGMVALAVAERRRELGIRAALGARPGALLRLAMGRGLRLCAAGTLAGLALSVLLAQGARGLLYGVAPTDPVTYLAAGLLLSGVALIACWLPARRAALANPAEVLQRE